METVQRRSVWNVSRCYPGRVSVAGKARCGKVGCVLARCGAAGKVSLGLSRSVAVSPGLVRPVRLGAVRRIGVGFGYKGMVRQARFGRDRQVGARRVAVSSGAAWWGRRGRNPRIKEANNGLSVFMENRILSGVRTGNRGIPE